MNRADIFIEVDELKAKLNDPSADNSNLRIYDATLYFFPSKSDSDTPYEGYLKGHIPGAAFLDHNDFSDADNPYMYMLLPEEKLAEQIGRMGIANDSEVIIYATGVIATATRIWWILRYAGHENVRILNGGLTAWTEAGGTLEQAPQSYAPATFDPQFTPGMFADKNDVLAAMKDGATCTEYTLPVSSYEGAYIPGSSFNSAMGLMPDMRTFVPDELFVSRFQQEAGHDRIITYCGGGFAATVNAIAHLIAGNKNVTVYDGSLTEWMGEGLPIERSN